MPTTLPAPVGWNDDQDRSRQWILDRDANKANKLGVNGLDIVRLCVYDSEV
jgi:hypothetical protein